MKKLFILFAFTFVLFSCDSQDQKDPSVIATISNSTYLISRPIHTYNIDGCEYIGSVSYGSADILTHKGNCKNPIHNSIHLSSYQFQITDPDHASLYDGDKLIGSFKFTNTELDSLIRKDNL